MFHKSLQYCKINRSEKLYDRLSLALFESENVPNQIGSILHYSYPLLVDTNGLFFC